MDFHSFARRDLQFLCKKNGVPANLTNVAMAKALEALETVEGIEEIQAALGDHSFKINSSELRHTSRRTSSRRVTHGDEPSSLPRSHRKTVKTPEVTEMASKEDEIKENLTFQSPAVRSPELPRTGRRTSARRAALGEEPKIRQLKPSPLTNDLKVYKKVEESKKEVPQILPKTPATTRKAAKGAEAQSSRRRAKQNEEVVMVTRRSARLSSRKALEESANAESKSRSIGRENSAVKMKALAKEDATEHEKKEGKTDLVENGDSFSVVTVEEHGEKDQEAESHEFSSTIEEDDSNGELDHRRSTRLSSKKPMKEKNREKDLAVKSDSPVVAPAEEDEEEKKKEESHVALSQGYSSSIEVENDDSIVKLIEEVENNDQEIEGENRDSTVVNDQELEIQAFYSSIERTNSNVEQSNFSNVPVDDEGQRDQEESHDLSSFWGDNLMQFESTEESSDQPPENEHVKDSGDQSPENEYLEVYQAPENDLVEDSTNLGSKFVEVSGDLSRTDEVPPLLHKEAIGYIPQPSGIEEEEAEKLCLLFTEMTLKEPEDISFISKKLPATMAPHQHAELVTTADIAFPKANHTSLDLPPPLVTPSLFSENVEATTNLLGNEITTAAIRETPEVKESGGVITDEIPAAIEELISTVIDGLSISDELSSSEKSVELCVEFSGDPVAAMSSPLKLPCESETIPLVESLSSIVQNQSSEEAAMAATEIAEEKEQANAKDGNLKLLSLTKLRAMYKQKLMNGTKTEQEKQKSITEQDFERLSCIQKVENSKQKLNDDMIKKERKKSLIKQEDLSCKLKLNEDTIKPETKRTPLKNLNYSTV